MESKIHEKLVFIWSPFFSLLGPGRIGKSLLKGSELKAKSCSGSPDKTPQELWNCPKYLKCLPLKFPILTDLSKYVRIWLKFHKFFDQWKDVVVLREAPLKKSCSQFGHCPFGEGGLNACQDGLGHLFREELSKFKWAFAWLWGGHNACQDGSGHLCSENWMGIKWELRDGGIAPQNLWKTWSTWPTKRIWTLERFENSK